MIHYGDDGAFEEAYWDDAHLVGGQDEWVTAWLTTSMELRHYPEAVKAKFTVTLRDTDDGTNVKLFADEQMLRDIREAINVALGED